MINVSTASELATFAQKARELIHRLSAEEGTQDALKIIPSLMENCIFNASQGRIERMHPFSIPNTIIYHYNDKHPEVYHTYATNRGAYEEAYTSTIIDFFTPYGYRVYVSERHEEENRIILTISWEGANE